MRARLATTTLCTAALLLIASTGLAASPGELLVEGVMHNGAGGPAADGSYDMTFSIYDQATGGSQAWSEGPVKVAVTAGRWAYSLGAKSAVDPDKLQALSQQWLEIKVGTDPALPRQRMHSVAFALHAKTADAMSCSGCINGKHIAGGSLGPAQVNFAYASAADGIKGGDAKAARGLNCTGCVTLKHIKFDGDVNLAGKALTAGKVTVGGDIISGGIVAGKQFVGDGSKLTGIKTPAGTCSKPGEVVKGIDANGGLICVAGGLPNDGLKQVSNGMLSNQFTDVANGAAKTAIPDNSPDGVLDTIDFPDIGLAQKLTISVDIKNSDTNKVVVWLFPPNAPTLPAKISSIVKNYPVAPNIDGTKYPHYVLHNLKQFDAKDKTIIKGTWPKPNKEVAGNIHNDWLGKNVKGKWRLLVMDTGFLNNDKDGAINSWKIQVQTVSNQAVEATGKVFVSGVLSGGYNGHGAEPKPLKLADRVTMGGVTTWYGRYQQDSRPYLFSYRPDDGPRGNYSYYDTYRTGYAADVKDDFQYLRRLRMEVQFGDRTGDFMREFGWMNNRDSTDEGQIHIAAWVKNTTNADIKHTICYRYSHRDNSSRRGSFSVNNKNIRNSTDNNIRTYCDSVTFPKNKTSFLVLQCGGRYYTGEYNWYVGKYVCGFYSGRLGAKKHTKNGLPDGLEWDYKRFYQYSTY